MENTVNYAFLPNNHFGFLRFMYCCLWIITSHPIIRINHLKHYKKHDSSSFLRSQKSFKKEALMLRISLWWTHQSRQTITLFVWMDPYEHSRMNHSSCNQICFSQILYFYYSHNITLHVHWSSIVITLWMLRNNARGA